MSGNTAELGMSTHAAGLPGDRDDEAVGVYGRRVGGCSRGLRLLYFAAVPGSLAYKSRASHLSECACS